MDAHIAVLHTKVDSLIEKQKELTARVRANEKVVAAVTLLGTVVIAIIGAGYFAPKAEACSPRLDGEPTYCPPWDDVILRDPPDQPITKEPTLDYSNGQMETEEFRWDAGTLIQKLRDWESEKNRTPVEDAINNALADMEIDNGSDGSTESEELLQLSSDGDSKSP